MAKKVNPSKFFLLLIGGFVTLAVFALKSEFSNVSDTTFTQQENNQDNRQLNKQLTEDITICSWNIQHFGKSKKDAQMSFIANTLKDFDIVAIQEVASTIEGEKAVVRLQDKLDSICKTCAWDFEISPINTGNPNQKERYVYFWKKTRVKKEGQGWLDPHYSDSIEREPFFSDFSINGKKFTMVNFHAVPKGKQPEKEIKFFKYYPELYSDKHLIFMGDFNLKHTHSVYGPLKKKGYPPILENEKTTLRMKCINGDCLASYYDNFYYEANYFTPINSGVIHFNELFDNDLKAARKISDHLPIYFQFKIQ